MARALLIEDKAGSLQQVRGTLARMGHDVLVATSLRAASRRSGDATFDVVYMDMSSDAGEKRSLLPTVLSRFPLAQVVVVADGGSARAIALLGVALRAGASDFLVRPITGTDITRGLRLLLPEPQRTVGASASS